VKAREYFLKCLEINQPIEINGDRDRYYTTASSYHMIGFTNYKEGGFQEAYENYSKALEMKKVMYKVSHPEVGLSYLALGKACYRLGDFEKALEYCEKSLEIYKSVQGNHDPFINRAQRKINKILKLVGSF